MRKIKTQVKQEKKPMNKNTKILLYALAGIVALVIIILIVIEGSSSRIILRNNSELKLESVRAYFQDAEDVMYDELMFEDIENGQTIKKDIDKMNFSYSEATLRVSFKFEGQENEMFVDAGYFNDVFSGRINIGFSDTEDGNIFLKVKASNGLLPSSNIVCDEEYVFDLEEGEIE